MSPSSLESQIAEHPGAHQSELHTGNLALSINDFSALEERIARTVTLIKSERQARAAAEHRLESLDVQLSEQQAVVKNLQEEIRVLSAEREQVRQRVERLLSQLDALEV